MVLEQYLGLYKLLNSYATLLNCCGTVSPGYSIHWLYVVVFGRRKYLGSSLFSSFFSFCGCSPQPFGALFYRYICTLSVRLAGWLVVCLSGRSSVCLACWLSVCLAGCLPWLVGSSVCLDGCLSVWMTVCLSGWLSVCLDDCLFVSDIETSISGCR
jgi:hypothetical protein